MEKQPPLLGMNEIEFWFVLMCGVFCINNIKAFCARIAPKVETKNQFNIHELNTPAQRKVNKKKLCLYEGKDKEIIK